MASPRIRINDDMDRVRPAWVEIDLGALRHNVGLLQRRVGPDGEVMAVVKSNSLDTHRIPEAETAALRAQ